MVRLTKLVALLAALWLVVWGVASVAVPKVLERMLPRLAGNARGAGIALEELEFERIQLSPSLLRLSISNVNAMFNLKPDDRHQVRSRFDAVETIVYLNRPLQRRGGVIFDNFEVVFDPEDRPRRLPFNGFSKGYVHIHSLPLARPRQAVEEILQGLEELFLNNELVGDFEFNGEVLVRVDETTIPALVYTERQGSLFRLRFSKPDVIKIAEASDVELSDDQVEIISLYPIRVPELIRITDEARDFSKQEFSDQPWLADALRHVSWSYLLTREFGADFAKQVTDAHEMNPGNTPNEHLMDYNNNAVGRIFAEDGVSFEELPLHVLAHDDIVRKPEEVDSRSNLLR